MHEHQPKNAGEMALILAQIDLMAKSLSRARGSSHNDKAFHLTGR